MTEVLSRMPWERHRGADLEELLTREWLVTNGLGGYASGTIAGAATRRYHGLLIAALPGALGRVVMLNHLFEYVRLADGTTVPLGGEEWASRVVDVPGAGYLTEFHLDAGLPVWRYEVGQHVLEKRLLMPHMQNTVHVQYRQVSGIATLRLQLRPSVHFRPHDSAVSADIGGPYVLTAIEDRYEIALADASLMPPLRMVLRGQRGAFTIEGRRGPTVLYRVEESRGYDHTGDLWCPGHLEVDLPANGTATLIASTEAWPTIFALGPQEAEAAEKERRRRLLLQASPGGRQGAAAELVLAADQFIITPAGRAEEAARAHAAGDEVRTVIAGYHWFTDWGRDTLISLEGLTLTTGRHAEAGYILRTFAHYVRDGLIPNFFPEGQQTALYHTADATLWFFHALARYVAVTGDCETLRLLLPTLLEIVQHHLVGTRFNIGIDPHDGLLRQGAQGHQLTWMDAKVGDWVVTPRRGKAVEINALWYNALRLLENWVREHPAAAHHQFIPEGDLQLPQGEAAASALARYADQVFKSFNERFWYAAGNYLYDVLDGEAGNDAACRPNQVFAISLSHPVLARDHWAAVLHVVEEKLLTPVGLRSLAPDHPDYKSRYFGDLRARDAAYHQGTVWAWLIGPFIDAWLKVHPEERDGAGRFLQGFRNHLSEACLGSISEVFDAEAPFTPRGCIAQAWSVAEVLRCWERVTGA